jgi:hypothetical protein
MTIADQTAGLISLCKKTSGFGFGDLDAIIFTRSCTLM